MGQQLSIAHYRITSKLGAGGMGEVWRATDTKLNRDVAIKILPEVFAQDTERMARFTREAQVLASLNHPNIAAIYGLEESSGVRALVMELVEGPMLADRIAQGPIPLSEVLNTAKQITEGLEYAHEKGIVHRDMKPANVKITPEGTVKLLDFGLAKAVEEPAVAADPSISPTLTMQSTRAGVILGTAAYMAPEQARGAVVDRRADIWAFGCVLYQMLTGKRAFGGESVTDTLAEIIKVDPDWSRIPANTPKTIRVLIQRCLKKDPKQRLQAIGEARITIEEVLAGKNRADDEEKESANASWPRVQKRSRSFTAWIGGFVLGAALTAVVAVWAARSRSAPAAMHFSAVTSFAGVQAQPALSPDGRSVAFVSNRDGHFNVYVGLVRGGELVQVTHGTSLKSRPSWSPDGSTLAYAQINDSGSVDVWKVSALGGSARKILLDANDPTWAPDGRSLVYENMMDGSIWTSGVSGESPHLLIRMDHSDMATELRVSPDGKMIAIAVRAPGPYGELGVADVSTRKVRKLTQDYALALSPGWSPDSRFIYFSSSRGGTLNVWKIGADGNGLRQVTAGEGDDAELDVSSDGKRRCSAPCG
jgi:serine/threonine-protein kinase